MLVRLLACVSIRYNAGVGCGARSWSSHEFVLVTYVYAFDEADALLPEHNVPLQHAERDAKLLEGLSRAQKGEACSVLESVFTPRVLMAELVLFAEYIALDFGGDNSARLALVGEDIARHRREIVCIGIGGVGVGGGASDGDDSSGPAVRGGSDVDVAGGERPEGDYLGTHVDAAHLVAPVYPGDHLLGDARAGRGEEGAEEGGEEGDWHCACNGITM